MIKELIRGPRDILVLRPSYNIYKKLVITYERVCMLLLLVDETAIAINVLI